MAERIREHPWALSDLGAPEGWPTCLRTSVDLMLRSSVAMAIYWGPSAITIQNDAFDRLTGEGSDLLGEPFGSAWREFGPVLRDAMLAGLNGESLSVRHQHLAAPAIQPDERWLDFDFSPIPDVRGWRSAGSSYRQAIHPERSARSDTRRPQGPAVELRVRPLTNIEALGPEDLPRI